VQPPQYASRGAVPRNTGPVNDPYSQQYAAPQKKDSDLGGSYAPRAAGNGYAPAAPYSTGGGGGGAAQYGRGGGEDRYPAQQQLAPQQQATYYQGPSTVPAAPQEGRYQQDYQPKTSSYAPEPSYSAQPQQQQYQQPYSSNPAGSRAQVPVQSTGVASRGLLPSNEFVTAPARQNPGFSTGAVSGYRDSPVSTLPSSGQGGNYSQGNVRNGSGGGGDYYGVDAASTLDMGQNSGQDGYYGAPRNAGLNPGPRSVAPEPVSYSRSVGYEGDVGVSGGGGGYSGGYSGGSGGNPSSYRSGPARTGPPAQSFSQGGGGVPSGTQSSQAGKSLIYFY